MKPLLAAALLATALTACNVEDVVGNDCRKAIGVAFLDQSVAVRDRMQQISWRESRWTPSATNGQHYGCVQIATNVHAARIRRHGFTKADMLRAWPNAVIARSLYVEQGFRPWAL
jgi:hypothetical protein